MGRLPQAAFPTVAEARPVEAGLDRAEQAGQRSVVVLGLPAYYRRFGFRAEAVRGMASPYAGPAPMGLALAPGGLSEPRPPPSPPCSA